MPANNRLPATQPSSSPTSKNVSKYANKDGSKFIALPKAPIASLPPQSGPTSPNTMPAPQNPVLGSSSNCPPQGVNPKKQKRRQKNAAKAAAAAAAAAPALVANGHSPPPTPSGPREPLAAGASTPSALDADEVPTSYPAQSLPSSSQTRIPLQNGVHEPFDISAAQSQAKAKKTKRSKRKKKAVTDGGDLAHEVSPRYKSSRSRDDERFWNTNTNEERERIKNFWINLTEEERKNLVKLEKDTILSKMKEQQKNTCSCAVCGRKRSAIEQELEGLYDSYYRELENYANRADGSLLGGPGNFALQTRENMVAYHAGIPPQAPMGSDALRGVDDEEDSYPEEELEDDDDPYSEEDISDDDRRENDQAISDFLDFGNSLQVKGKEPGFLPFPATVPF